MGTGLQAVSLALLAAFGWGTADLIGGLTARRTSVFVVMAASTLISLVPALFFALFLGNRFGERFLTPTEIGWSVLAGAAGMLGFTALFSALGRGKMGVVAPISGVVTTITAGIGGFILQGWPDAIKWIGLGFALVGIWLLSGPEFKGSRWVEYLLAIAAGLGFGAYYLFIGQANHGSVFWPLVVMSAANIPVLLILVGFLAPKPLQLRSAPWIQICALALLNFTAGVLFLVAARLGQLGPISVIASLYPAFTVILASLFLKEKLEWVQWVGVVVSFIAIAVISS